VKVWQYQEMRTKVLTDLDLMDETFITEPELVGYFNEAIEEAESEIVTLPRCDYFKIDAYLPWTTGKTRFALPANIYINKIRKIVYENSAIIYTIEHFRPQYEFEDVAFATQYGQSDDYRYQLLNPDAGGFRLKITPALRESAVLPPTYPFPDALNKDYGGSFPGYFAPFHMWFIRSARRMPIPTFNNVQGELRFTESWVGTVSGTSVTSVNLGGNNIQTVCGLLHNDGITPFVAGGILYTTGDILYLSVEPGGILPAPLVANTPYYVIASGTLGVIQLATTLQNAQLGTPITLTTVGTGFFDVQCVTTQAILNNLLVDIPQFATFVMQWVKCRCLEKDGDPRLAGAVGILEQQRKQMQDTLVEMIPDLNTEIEPDFSSYQEMS
jgi:hypothetical protein